MTKARTNASVAPAVGRNMIINGAMNVAQRSASVADVGASVILPTCDRWIINPGATAGRVTVTQTADGPNGISANCLKIDCTTADASIASGEQFILEHKLEGQNVQRIGKGVVGAKQVTISFYVKANAIFNFALEFFDADNSRNCSKLFATTTDWVRQELTFPADVDDGSSPFDDDNAASVRLFFWLHAGSDFTSGTLQSGSFANNTNANRAAGIDSILSNTANNFFITGVQMEVGPVATEFEQEEISVTLKKCYRYFQKIAAASGAVFKRFGFGYTTTNRNGDFLFPLETTLRDVPTIVTTGTAANYCVYHANTITACDLVPFIDTGSDAGIQNGMFVFNVRVASGLTAGQGVTCMSNDNTSAFLSLDAEL